MGGERFAHLVERLQWLPEHVNFTNLARCGGWSTRWFAHGFPFARQAAACRRTAGPECSFVPKSGRKIWGLGWFWSGMVRAGLLESGGRATEKSRSGRDRGLPEPRAASVNGVWAQNKSMRKSIQSGT